MAKAVEAGGVDSSLTAEEVQVQAAMEGLYAAKAGLANAEVNAGLTTNYYDMPTPTTVGSANAMQSGNIAAPNLVMPTSDPLRNKTVKPTAPTGYYYAWIGGTTTGSWQLYKNPGSPTPSSGPTGPSTGATGPVTSPTGATGATGSSNPLIAQNVFDAAKNQLMAWGIYKTGDAASDALLKQIQDLATTGAGSDTISLAIQRSDAYKARFAGNEARLAKGLAALTPAEYINTEKTYDQILRASGVPEQFYRSTGEMAKLIGADVSATELANRVDLAKKTIANSDPYYTQTLQTVYGLSQGDMIAHVLDPTAAMPLIEKQVNATAIGAEAARQGLGYSQAALESLAGMGITSAQAQKGFRDIALGITPAQKLAATWGGDAAIQGQNLVASTFGTAGAAYAEQQLQKLAQRETSAFQGSSGIAKGSLGTAAAEAAGGIS